MYKIYKYKITTEDINNEFIVLPYGAEILSVTCQYNIPILYCLVDPHETRTENRPIIIKGTGWDIDNETVNRLTYHHFNFLGTIQQYNSELVWHVWVK